MRKICVVTGTRAEYGLLYLLMKELQADDNFLLQIIVTGAHLSAEFGLTYKNIEADGFKIDEKVEMLLSGDTPVSISKSMALCTIGCTEALERLQPDLLVILGDRYEMLAAAQAAMLVRVPIAHIAGGDTTEGAMDEAIRHSITKMSHLHFVTNGIAARRVKQMGENPDYVYEVGSPGIDLLRKIQLINRKELQDELGFSFFSRNILVTFHPVTLECVGSSMQFAEVLRALEKISKDVGIIFTYPNADTNGRIIIDMINDFVRRHSNSKSFSSLGQRKYLSVISQVDAVVGNSSSGLYEAPSFGKPTVDIGDRQKGRIKASSVISCVNDEDEIYNAITRAFTMDCSNVVNPYGDGKAVPRIIDVLKNVNLRKELVKKHFFLL